MNKILGAAFALLLFWSLLSAPVAASESEPPIWAPSCKELKAKHLSGRDLDVVFSPKPRLSNKRAHWTLAWNGVDVPLPQTSYKDIVVSVNAGNGYELWLVTTGGALIALMSDSDMAMEDVFAHAGGHGEAITSKSGVANTREIFGGSVRLSTIMKLAYESTPDMLTCLEANRVRESAMAVALILKGVATGRMVAAYKDIGTYDGWITKSVAEENIIYDLNVIPADGAPRRLLIHYKLPAGSPYEYLPVAMGHHLPPSEESPPNWLAALNAALKSGRRDRWQTFVTAAGKAGISEKSLLRTSKALKLAPAP